MKYHKIVKNIVENRKDLRKELFAHALTQNDKRNLWTEVKKMEKSSMLLVAVVDGKDIYVMSSKTNIKICISLTVPQMKRCTSLMNK